MQYTRQLYSYICLHNDDWCLYLHKKVDNLHPPLSFDLEPSHNLHYNPDYYSLFLDGCFVLL